MLTDDYVDPTLDISGLTRAGLRDFHGFRLRGSEALAAAAVGAKRRLGGDALPAQLAADKKLCRRIRHQTWQLRQLWLSEDWAARPLAHTSMAEPKGDPGVVWERHAQDQLVEVAVGLAQVATWAALVPGAGQLWAKQRITLLEREQRFWQEVAGVQDAQG